MDTVKITANRRDVIGKKVKLLRQEGKLPAVVYGKEMEQPLPIVLDLRETTKILRDVSRATLLTIDVDGEEFTALVRERQREVMTGVYQHVDFLAISMTETVRTQVNVFVEGVSPAIEEFGAIITTGASSVEVEALPGDLPESIMVDVSGLTSIGDTIMVGDLKLPKGVEVLSDPEEMLVVVSYPMQAAAEEEEEGLEEDLDFDAEPEVIGREDDEDDEE